MRNKLLSQKVEFHELEFNFRLMAGLSGIEPIPLLSESSVLPLYEKPI